MSEKAPAQSRAQKRLASLLGLSLNRYTPLTIYPSLVYGRRSVGLRNHVFVVAKNGYIEEGLQHLDLEELRAYEEQRKRERQWEASNA